MKVLNLYAGIGGNRKLWEDVEVTAVELNPEVAEVYKSYFPDDKIIIADAHQYLLDHYKEFDFIWSSPPCPTHSKMVKFTRHEVTYYPDMALYQEIIFLENLFKGLYVVENVVSYYDPLIPPVKCDRHYFWSNFLIGKFEKPKFNGDYMKAKKSELESYYGYKEIPMIYLKGNHSSEQVLRNCVHPETGLYILNCARGVIRKQNEKQLDLF